MNTHTEILKMIKTVDPDDTVKLDEIDARVWCFLRCEEFGSVTRQSIANDIWLECETKLGVDFDLFPSSFYTGSRDALKAIRPEGWIMGLVCQTPSNSWKCRIEKTILNSFESDWCKSEELAELHAIIQAIAYERGEK